jgi:predicted permease
MMEAVLSAIIPIVAILILGKAVDKAGWVSVEGWLGLERTTYFVLFPALIISKLAVADFQGVDWRMPIALISAQVLIAGSSIAFGKLLNQPGERIGVFVQSGVRWNTFIALALAQDLLGDSGVAMIAAAAAVMVPTSNLLSIAALSRFSDGSVGIGKLALDVILNPLIIASIVGLSINVAGITLAAGLMSFMDILSDGAVAIGLLATGAYVQLRNPSSSVPLVLGWSTFRLFGLPLLAGGIALALGVTPEIFLVILIATAVPTASNGAILARNLGGDATLAANLIAVQTILAIVSVMAIFFVAKALGLI